MSDIREAFLRAAGENPQSEFVNDVYGANSRAVKADRERASFEKACREANIIGHMWFKLRADPMIPYGGKVGWNLEDVKGKWGKLKPYLVQTDDRQRGAVLMKMAEGMRLLRERPHSNYESQLIAAKLILFGTTLTSEKDRELLQKLYPRVFLKAIEELSGYNLSDEVFAMGDRRNWLEIKRTVLRVSELLPSYLSSSAS